MINAEFGRLKHTEESKALMRASMAARFGPPENRFWSRVNKDGPICTELGTQCWVWIGDCYPDGYGRFWFKGKNVRVTRYIYTIIYGELGEGQQVLHKCDNPKCVRPDHLFAGTQRNNIDDMVRKGRSQYGENHCRSLLTEEQVIEALKWKRGCGERLYEMAARFGVSVTCLEQIRFGKNWQHLYHLHSRFDK